MSTSIPAEAPLISVVVPVYNERDNLEPLVDRVHEALAELDGDFELLLVDDGSNDGSVPAMQALEAKWPKVRGVYLARNYGQSTALQAGIDSATGIYIVTMDGDLQNDPADIPRLLALLEDEDVDVVCGWRRKRNDPPVRKFFSKVANRIIRRLTRVEVHDFGCTLKIYRSEIVRNVQIIGEMHRFLPALLVQTGARVTETPVNHSPRLHGVSKYSLDRTLRVVLDLLLVMFFHRYVQRPLHLFGGLGVAALVPGSLILFYLAALKLVGGASIGERPLLTLGVMLVLIGIMLIGQGLLGEVMTRMFFHPSMQPQYLLRITPVRVRRRGKAKVADAATDQPPTGDDKAVETQSAPAS